jgi:hypothetical protein
MFHIFIFLLIVISSDLKITRLHCWLTCFAVHTFHPYYALQNQKGTFHVKQS